MAARRTVKAVPSSSSHLSPKKLQAVVDRVRAELAEQLDNMVVPKKITERDTASGRGLITFSFARKTPKVARSSKRGTRRKSR